MTTTSQPSKGYELKVTPHWSHAQGPRPTTGHAAIRVERFATRDELVAELRAYGIPSRLIRALMPGVYVYSGERYEWSEIVEPVDEPKPAKRQSKTVGADIVKALSALLAAGHGDAAIALGTRRSMATVYRWRNGLQRPNAESLTRLIEMIDDRRRVLLARHDIREPRTAHELRALDDARDALETDVERAEVAVLVERWTDRRCAADEQEEAPKPPASYNFHTDEGTTRVQVDPFELIAKAQPAERELPF